MRFALVDDERRRPKPGLRGRCSRCQHEMIAKCGDFVAWHWAHKGRRRCDPWAENETDWHRDWKDCFPEESQEVVHTDPATGERHFADVKTDTGLVVEFQHSPIKQSELESRELFYGNMIWVVDGDRGGLDAAYFYMGLSNDPLEIDPVIHGLEWWGKSKLLHRWADTSKPVFYDFGYNELWHIRDFQPTERTALAYWIPRDSFLEQCLAGGPIRPVAVDEKDAPKLSRRLVQLDRIPD